MATMRECGQSDGGIFCAPRSLYKKQLVSRRFARAEVLAVSIWVFSPPNGVLSSDAH